VCGTNDWHLGDVVELRTLHADSSGVSYLMTPLRCKNCTNTLFFNPIALGVLDNDGELIEENQPKETTNVEDDATDS